MADPVKENFDYYLDHQKELVEQYSGRVLVITDKKVVGDFASHAEAYDFAIKNFQEGSFVIQLCTPGDQDYTQTYHSRVIL